MAFFTSRLHLAALSPASHPASYLPDSNLHGIFVPRLTRKHHEGAHHLRWGFFVVLFYWQIEVKEHTMIRVNGEEVECTPGLTLAELVSDRGLDRARVAVELNGAIVPRDALDATLLHDDDKVEIVHFVGGG